MNKLTTICAAALFGAGLALASVAAPAAGLESDFATPPEVARPWVYWYFMDGNLSRDGMTADLEAMKQAGIGGAIMLEVNIGIPRGPVEFMSPRWRELMAHAIHEADRLGIEIALGAGPGWCGTGGPWVKPGQSMQHLVASEIQVAGPARFDGPLPQPQPRTPFFGEGTLTPELRKQWKEFYQDVVVVAFPTPEGGYRIPDVDEKALYYRAPYSSQPGVKPFLTADRTVLPAEQCIPTGKVVELALKDGRLVWDVPPGKWTVMRFGRTLTGQTTRPAPVPGLGFESDKFDRDAIDAHFESFIGKLLKTVGEPQHPGRGLTMAHFDSWEMSSQNWSPRFREEFRRRRGYDSAPFLPAMLGRVVGSVELSERFLWDLRRTAQELVVENHAVRLKELGREHGLGLSIEPYDLNPAGDLALGAVADVPQCEFWSKGYGFSSEFSCFEAVSIAHTMGRPITAAEAFTSASDAWKQFPGSMKAQGDWALCAGINRIIFHRYQHQPRLDRFPGMTMGPYGVHWERTQTWWPMVPSYHTYLARCQALLRRGAPVADILYLDLEGAPSVFRPPASALLPGFPDHRGYNFDGCAGGALIERASEQGGRIVFPDGMSYSMLVLPRTDAMTPALLRKIQQLAAAGATILGAPPQRAPGLENYPQCDAEVRRLGAEIWPSEHVRRDEETSAQPPKSPLEPARWVWHHEGNPAASAPVGKRHFRREVDIPGAVESATFTLTADNSFELSVNGRLAGTGDNFHEEVALDVTAFLKPGTNLLSVTAVNTGDAPNPAGWIGTLAVRLRGGGSLVVTTDGKWSSALTPEGPWAPVLELGAWNMPPWNLKGPSGFPDSYPDYQTTARILAGMGVAPDFESDGDVRYIHRRDGGADLYFVGNRTAAPLTANCRFRVTGRQPELWDPVTGGHRPLPEFSLAEGRTTVPLTFAPDQSFFVVFRAGFRGRNDDPALLGKNAPTLREIAVLPDAWTVQFDPARGGPAEAVPFGKLGDWTKRTEQGIRHYSGIATYRQTFDLAPADRGSASLFLDLGVVHEVARIRLNGRDLGVVWCAPWRVDLSPAVREKGNELEIEVANLWPNRLIGDAGLPEEKRISSATWQPYTKDSPLLPSGLLGPVRVMSITR